MIPNILHFVFGMEADFGGRPFSFTHYMAIKSAIEVNKPEAVYFYYCYEPESELWDLIKPELTLIKVKPVTHVFGRKVNKVAHKADVIRMQALIETGGIYLDLDTISKKPFTDLLDNSFVIGGELDYDYERFRTLQYDLTKFESYYSMYSLMKKGLRGFNGFKNFRNGAPIKGTCNAVMLSEKGGKFVKDWFDQYRTFDDSEYCYHSIILPYQMYLTQKFDIHIESWKSFHYPLYDAKGLAALFAEDLDFKENYVHHMWESWSWEPYVKDLTAEKVMSVDTTYNRIARKFLTTPQHAKSLSSSPYL